MLESRIRGAVTSAVTGGVGAGVMSKVLGRACFVADTQVGLGDGSSKAIQDVVVGDEVLAWNQATGGNEPRRVVETFVHEGVETWEVETADGQVITSTAEHPFWVEGKGWTPVRELTAGDVLAAADGPIGLVRVEATGETARVYNVHVDGLHNYHVGRDEYRLRVHNDCHVSLYKAPQRGLGRQQFEEGYDPSRFPGDGAYFTRQREIADSYAVHYGEGVIEVKIPTLYYDANFAQYEYKYPGTPLGTETVIPPEKLSELSSFERIWHK